MGFRISAMLTKTLFFSLQYDCCAVNEVIDTNNDFDRTPWCTTSGSCQDTASQIPKTCCKDVTKDNYDRASPNCYASVSVGTYKPVNNYIFSINYN